MTVMLENGVIPIVNENDTISVSELMFTDNDELSGLIASMMDAQALVILSNVDGIYDSDPALNPDAKKYDRLTFSDIVNKGLKAMDATAATMCMENDIPVLAFALGEEDSILRAVCGESLGTLISNE